MRSPPVVHLYCLCWNDQAIIPHFLRHYGPWVSRFHILDNWSTDRSVALLSGDERITVERFDVGDSFIIKEQQLSETMWRRSRGVADWVVVLDMDEFLFNPDLPAYLERCAVEGVTALRGVGYEMVADRMPTGPEPLTEVAPCGVRSLMHDKLCVFDPQAMVETRFKPGRHGAAPIGRLRYPDSSRLALLHYKRLGLDYYLQRTLALSKGLRPRDVANKWGTEYFRPPEAIAREFETLRRRSRPAPGLAGGPPIEALRAEEDRIAATGLFDPDFYLAHQADVREMGFDPLSHYVVCGRHESRAASAALSA